MTFRLLNAGSAVPPSLGPWTRTKRLSPPRAKAALAGTPIGRWFRNLLPMVFGDGGHLPQAKEDTVASFGSAELIQRFDGRWELHGGRAEDHAAAREWCSLFQHEATFTSNPLTARAAVRAVPSPKAWR